MPEMFRIPDILLFQQLQAEADLHPSGDMSFLL